ncbi:NUDIX hydrolase [Adhaeribacter sp. BT258]|uniref:NUDIX hydrolase n=1 Tax=Adhaeribacter terrigena TaxID=2793070 RepID=A0ABS1C5P4_9BACT|nr:NUDIX domain-containing protein [Adhaeribacter terrigena]MBK0404710.1 NUDIX hydrolase [Adhaeribacter terrigena]
MEETNKFYEGKLRVRVCGINLRNKSLLLVCHKGLLPGRDFWAPPGGGLHYGESVQSCLKREFLEETGLIVNPGRFLFINEFLQAPLHAIELFFEVEVTGGELKPGTDPELSKENQMIAEVAYKNLSELSKIPLAEKHSIFHQLVDLDDLFIPDNRFI